MLIQSVRVSHSVRHLVSGTELKIVSVSVLVTVAQVLLPVPALVAVARALELVWKQVTVAWGQGLGLE